MNRWQREAVIICSLLVFLSASGGEAQQQASQPIKVGLGVALSGPASAYGPPIVQAAEVAVARINSAGGVLGRKIQLEILDDGTDPKVAAQNTNRAITQTKVPVIVSWQSSAARIAMEPIFERTGALLIYAALYEGHSCHWFEINLGEVPEQQAKAFPYLMQTLGGTKWYVVGDDYEWPRKTNAIARGQITAAGGQVVGEKFVPFGTSNFSEVLGAIKASGAHWILNLTVGADAETFFKQWASFGLKSSTKMVSLGVTDVTLQQTANAAVGTYAVLGYFKGVDTAANKAFLNDIRSRFGAKARLQDTFSESVYVGLNLWARAANKAGKTDTKAVIAAMDGLSLEAPRGTVQVDVRTHHVSQHIYLLQAKSDKTFHLVKDFGLIPPGPQCRF